LSTHKESYSFDCPGQEKAIESPTPLSKNGTQRRKASLDRRASIQDDIQETTFYTVWSVASDYSHTDSVQTAVNADPEPHFATDSCQKHSSSKITKVPESTVQSLIRCFEHNKSGAKESKVEANIPQSSSNHLDADCNVSISSTSSAVDVGSDSSVTKSEESTIAARDEPEQSFNSNLLFLGSTDHESLQPVRQRRRESVTGTRRLKTFDYCGDITKEALQPKSSSPRSRRKSSKKRSTRSSSSSKPGSMASKDARSSHSHSHSHRRDRNNLSSVAGSSVSSKMIRELDGLVSKGSSLGSSVNDSFVQHVLKSINGAVEEQMAQEADSFFDALEESVSVD
jgi:hypothetical protein